MSEGPNPPGDDPTQDPSSVTGNAGIPATAMCVGVDPAESEAIAAALAAASPPMTLESVKTPVAALERLQAPAAPTVVLLDASIPAVVRANLAQRIRAAGNVVLIQLIAPGEPPPVEVLKGGVDDYVTKAQGFAAQLPAVIGQAARRRAQVGPTSRPLTLLLCGSDVTARLYAAVPRLTIQTGRVEPGGAIRLSVPPDGPPRPVDAVVMDAEACETHALLAAVRSHLARAPHVPLVLLHPPTVQPELVNTVLTWGACAAVLKAGDFVPPTLVAIDRAAEQRALATERQALSLSEARVRLIVESLPSGVTLLEADGTCLAMNLSGLSLLGQGRIEDVVGRSLLDVVSPEQRETLAELLHQVADGARAALTLSCPAPDGETRRILLRAVPLHREGARTAVLCALADAALEAAEAGVSHTVLDPGPMDPHIAELTAALEAERESRAALEDRLSRLDEERQVLQIELERARDDRGEGPPRQDHPAEGTGSESGVPAAEPADLRAPREDLDEARAAERTRLAERDVELAELREQVARLREAETEITAGRDAAVRELDDLRARHEGAIQALDRERANWEELSERCLQQLEDAAAQAEAFKQAVAQTDGLLVNIAALQSRVASTTAERDELTNRLSSLETRYASLQEQYEQASRAHDAERAEWAELATARLEEASQAVPEDAVALQDLEERNRELERTCESLRRDGERAATELEALRVRYEQMRQTHDAERGEWAQLAAERLEGVRQSAEEVQAARDALAERDYLAEQLRLMRQARDTLAEECDAARHRVRDLEIRQQEELRARDAAHGDREHHAAQLEARRRELEGRLGALERDAARARDLEATVQARDAELSGLREALERIERERSDLGERLREADTQRRTAEDEARSRALQIVEAHQRDRRAWQEAREALERALAEQAALAQRHQQADESATRHAAALDQARAEIARLKGEAARQQREQLPPEEYVELRRRLDEALQAADAERAARTGAERTLSAAQARFESERAEWTATARGRSDLEQQVAELRRSHASIEAALEAAQARYERLSTEHWSERTQHDRTRHRLDRAQEEIETHKAAARASVRALRALERKHQEAVQRHRDERRAAQRSSERLDHEAEQAAAARRELDAQRRAYDQAVAERESIVRRLNEIQAEFARQQQLMSAQHSALHTRERTRHELEAELAKARLDALDARRQLEAIRAAAVEQQRLQDLLEESRRALARLDLSSAPPTTWAPLAPPPPPRVPDRPPASRQKDVGEQATDVTRELQMLLAEAGRHGEALLQGLDVTSPLRVEAEELRRVSLRAASLSHRLFARSDAPPEHAEVIELGGLLAEAQALLSQVAGPDVEVGIDPADQRVEVHAFRRHLDDALVNVAVAARDALPDGGSLTLRPAPAAPPEHPAASDSGLARLDAVIRGPQVSASAPHEALLRAMERCGGRTAHTLREGELRLMLSFPTRPGPTADAGGGRSTSP